MAETQNKQIGLGHIRVRIVAVAFPLNTFSSARNLAQPGADNKAMAVSHDNMTPVGKLEFFAFSFAVQARVGIGG